MKSLSMEFEFEMLVDGTGTVVEGFQLTALSQPAQRFLAALKDGRVRVSVLQNDGVELYLEIKKRPREGWSPDPVSMAVTRMSV